MEIENMRRKLANGKNMNATDMAFFLGKAIDGTLNESNKIEVLTLQNNKGIAAEEIAHAVDYLQKGAAPSTAIDVCGTGGSGLSRINTSTLSAFVLAALGVPVAKHGNRASSGRFGSFDLLEKIGITIDLSPEKSEEVYKKCGLGFFFAPKCFPQMGAFGLVRKAMGKPTMFNLLGPLLSPLNPAKQIIGTSTPKNAKLLIEAAKKMGKKEVKVVVGEGGLDEVVTTGKTHIWSFEGESVLSPKDFGVSQVSFDDIAGGDPEKNIRIAEEFLGGKLNSPHADLIHVNVALALQLVEKEIDLKKGVEMSKEAVASGKVKEKWEEVQALTRSIKNEE